MKISLALSFLLCVLTMADESSSNAGLRQALQDQDVSVGAESEGILGRRLSAKSAKAFGGKSSRRLFGKSSKGSNGSRRLSGGKAGKGKGKGMY